MIPCRMFDFSFDIVPIEGSQNDCAQRHSDCQKEYVTLHVVIDQDMSQLVVNGLRSCEKVLEWKFQILQEWCLEHFTEEIR